MTKLPELGIIKLLYSNDNYIKYFNSIDISYLRENFKETELVLRSLSSFHLKYARDATDGDLRAHFLTENPGLSPEERKIFDDVFDTINSFDSDSQVLADLLKSLREKALIAKITTTAFEASDGRKTLADILALTETAASVDEPVDNSMLFVTDDLQELYNGAIKEPGYRWRLASLNKTLGSLRRGDFGFVFARPETGKTTFLASEITYMATQGDRPVIWFNNEEQGNKVMLRAYQGALGVNLAELVSNIPKARDKFRELTRGNLRIYDAAQISKFDVERLCRELNPGLILFDQIDKITGFKADRPDLELGSIYQWARELAKVYGPVIGICQADGTGEGVKFLTMGHVANAKTAKQAEADWILGIGRSNDTGYEYVRHFHLSKNKLVGDVDSDPTRRHDRWDVLIQPEKARYEDIVYE